MKVHRLDSSFPYAELTPSVPRPLQGGGAFHSSLHCDGSTVHFQLPECTTKAGVVTSSRGGHVDLVYEIDKHDALMAGIESLEQSIWKIVASKKEVWFTNEVADEDIENMTIPLARAYKAGRSFTIRVSIPKSRLMNPNGFVFDERKAVVDHGTTSIKEHRVIPLVSLDGLKYTSRSITIELSALQLMVLDETETAGCLIATDVGQRHADGAEQPIPPPPPEEQQDTNTSDSPKEDESSLQEVSIAPNGEEEISLRSQTDVYRDLYEEAYEKAKRLKGAAIEAFAKAKEIRELYNLGNDFYSDSESDGAEIGDV